MKPSKTHFRPKEVQNLGHVLSADGIRMGEDRIKAFIDMKTPTTIKHLRSVLGTVDFIWKLIPKSGTNTRTLGLLLLASQLQIYRRCETIGNLNRTLLLSK